MSNRPFMLDPLFRSLNVLPGVGPRTEKLIAKLVDGPKVLDLLTHAPIDLIDRRAQPKIKDVTAGQVATLKISVQKHFRPTRRGAPYKVWCTDETGAISLVFFNARPDWVLQQLPEGAVKIVSGRIDVFNQQAQMVHPDAIGDLEDLTDIAVYEAVYPLTQGVTNKSLRKSILAGLGFVPDLPEWQTEALLKRETWQGWSSSLHMLHKPEALSDIQPQSKIRQRLAYDELLANQLALALVRRAHAKKKGRPFATAQKMQEDLRKSLPFKLTGAQQRAVLDINQDMAAPMRMLRLLQGDVGSGKTVVAALSALNAVHAGAQAAIMAPTEILARQHAETLTPLFQKLGLHLVTLTGRDKGKAREKLLQQISNGDAHIVIGTHALFQDTIEFADLGLAVIDEQHKFGVHQRLKLSDKGKGVDILVMTATPIPRTLTLTAYGDMEVSKLDEKPPGRKPIDTRLIASDHLGQMIESLKLKIAQGVQVYWVCPLVEESELIDLAAAEERHIQLQQLFGDKVGLVHGRMKAEEKDKVMQKFAAGDISLLIATTVIEVGVNVPNATVMIIEHAERFGLAQLHQLRGRVGRGDAQSYCFLMYDGPLFEMGKERLSIMRRTEDGFEIAEKDLELRGAGDVLGTKQSGLPVFKIADLEHHKDLLQMARDESKLILEKDPELKSPRGEALRTLLYLFERDQAISYLRSG